MQFLFGNDDMTRKDRDALKRCMEIAMTDPLRADQLRSKLEYESWEDVARFAANCVQGRSLRLRPWESPPCSAEVIWNDGSIRRDPDAGAMLDRMLAAGLSQYEPDPLAALQAAR